MGVRPIAEDLFTTSDDEPRLIGNRCPACGAVTFPVRSGCARCGSAELERYLLANRGTLWTWTTQGFPPGGDFNGTSTVSDRSVPWFVGLVELPGELRVEGLLVGITEETPEIGMAVRLTLVPFRTDDEGTEVVTFAFTPDDGAGTSDPRETEVNRA
jgi:uncharacterized OB-fold protein